MREAIDGYLFILPWLIGLVLFTAGPMLGSLVLAFVDWDLLGTPRWAGLANVQHLMSDRLVGTSLVNTAYYTFLSVPLRLALALGVALLLSASARGLSFFRTCFYLPAVVPAVANVILWMWLFNPAAGLLNMGLAALGLPKLQWLWDPALSKPSLVLMSLWTTGNVVIIFLAGLQGIPRGSTRRPRSTAPTAGSSSSTSRCPCCPRSSCSTSSWASSTRSRSLPTRS